MRGTAIAERAAAAGRATAVERTVAAATSDPRLAERAQLRMARNLFGLGTAVVLAIAWVL
jgi:hypothetical protein